MANIDSLVEVIKANLAKGVPAEKLIESAKAAGWSDSDIDDAFKQVNQPNTTQTTAPIQPTTQETTTVQTTQTDTTTPRNRLEEFKQTLMGAVMHPNKTLEQQSKTDVPLKESIKKLATQGALIGAFLSAGIMYVLILLALIAPDMLSSLPISVPDIASGLITLIGLTLLLTIGLAILLPIQELIDNIGTLILSKALGGKGTYAKQVQLTSSTQWITVATFALLLIPFIGLIATLILILPLSLVRYYALIRAVQYAHDLTPKKAAVVILLIPIISFLVGFILPMLSAGTG